MKILPKARTADIVENDLDKELLLYNLQTDKAYSLNETSKIVYLACDGVTTFDELRRRHEYCDDLIHFTLDELRAHKLIEDRAGNHFGGLSRREIIRRVGLATMVALPVIVGITAPSAAQAVSAVCNNRCECTEPNPFDDGFPRLCEQQLNGVQTGCDRNNPNCACLVMRGTSNSNSTSGMCSLITL